jgi:cupin fold WbuC family metalloprotein
MLIDTKLLDELTAQAKASPKLRMNLDLRNTPDDQSQRMLNALEPGTVMPIHRHQNTSETVVMLRGKVSLQTPSSLKRAATSAASASPRDNGIRWNVWNRGA